MRKSLALWLRRSWRRLKERSHYKLVSGGEIGEDIEIDSLIYPLRYDIIVRANFLAHYHLHRDTYVHDFSNFISHPAAKAYFLAWLSDARRSRPHLGHDPVSLQKEFEFRVRRAIKLFDSLRSHGYDRRHPIELRAASIIRQEHDKHVERRFYAGDGCHRLAFLASQGVTTLMPRDYRVRMYEEFQPRDNTYLLLGTLLCTETQYCRMISRYYCNGHEYEVPQRILEFVEQNNPNQLDEATSVLREDLRQIGHARDQIQATLVTRSGSAGVPQT